MFRHVHINDFAGIMLVTLTYLINRLITLDTVTVVDHLRAQHNDLRASQ